MTAEALNTIAWEHFQHARYPEAIAAAEEAIILANTTTNKKEEARAFDTLGKVVNNTGNLNAAEGYFLQALGLYEELGDKSGATQVICSIGNVYRNLSDYSRALEYYGKALAAHEELGDKSGAIVIIGNIGNVYANLSDYPRALEYYSKALAAHEELGDKSGAARVTGNIGIVYYSLKDYPHALEYYGKALAAHEELGDKSSVARDIGNIGLVYTYISDYPRALEYMGKALAAHEELGDKSGAARVTGNIGIVYSSLSDYSRALEYYMKALAAHEELGEKSIVARVIGNIGMLYSRRDFDGCDPAKAEEYLLKAIAINEELGTKLNLYKNHQALADLYKQEKRWEDFAVHFEKYHNVEKEVQSEEAKKQAQKADIDRKLAIERAEAAATKKLLHNTLPPEIADRLLAGERIADSHAEVSVLFADIVDFTRLSQALTAKELVEGLDSLFTTFDELAEKHGLEKIKTIGDCYMVIAGAPVARADHAGATARMALEMMDAVASFHAIATGEPMRLRIGLHSGEVVAGVIGRRKYTYDLWGDAVNTASRMESHGEAGKIHVSEAFARELIRKYPGQTLSGKEGCEEYFSFPLEEGRDGVLIERGQIEIKGKGMMKTYFLDKR